MSAAAVTEPVAVNGASEAEPAVAPVEVDTTDYVDEDADGDANSVTGSSMSASISSTIYNYKYENGRRYHAYRDGSYVLPNDDQEQDRLELHHHMWRLLLDGELYTAPLAELQPKRILDLGCGTGLWAIDIADEFPEAEIIGTDLSPIQPAWVPPNVRFYVDDYETNEWTFSTSEDEQFDFIHGRALCGTIADWPKFYANIYRHLRPGGILEMQEYDAWCFSDDDSVSKAPYTQEWLEALDNASKSFGKHLDVAKFQKEWIEGAGFVDVKEIKNRIPLGPWAKDSKLKELGRCERIHMQMSVESHTPALYTRVLGKSQEETQTAMDGVKAEFLDRNLHLITQYRFLTGRKPEN